MNYQLFFYKNIKRISILFFFLFLFLHFCFHLKTQDVKPNPHIVPPLPNKYLVSALSLGDKEFYFRVLALKIQNAGDTFGRFPPLKKYDYKKLYQWFTFLDSLNSNSRVIPSLASYYYSQTQNKPDVIHMIRYLDEHASRDINKHWWWLYQATYNASMILGDDNLALELAHKLSKNEDPNAPLWTKQLPAFLHADMNQDCEAYFIIKQILDDHESGRRIIKPEEMDFMRKFIQQRISDLQGKKFDASKCKSS